MFLRSNGKVPPIKVIAPTEEIEKKKWRKTPELTVIHPSEGLRRISNKVGQLVIIPDNQTLSLRLISPHPDLLDVFHSLCEQSLDPPALRVLLGYMKHAPATMKLKQSDLLLKTKSFLLLDLTLFNFLLLHFLDLHFQLSATLDDPQSDFTDVLMQTLQGLRGSLWSQQSSKDLTRQTHSHEDWVPEAGLLGEYSTTIRLRGLFRIFMWQGLKRLSIQSDFAELGMSAALVSAWPAFRIKKRMVIACDSDISRWEINNLISKLASILQKNPGYEPFEVKLLSEEEHSIIIEETEPGSLPVIYLALLSRTRDVICPIRFRFTFEYPLILINNRGEVVYKHLITNSYKVVFVSKDKRDLRYCQSGVQWGGRSRIAQIYPDAEDSSSIVQYVIWKVANFELDSYNQTPLITQSKLLSKTIFFKQGQQTWQQQGELLNYALENWKMNRIIIWLYLPGEAELLRQSIRWYIDGLAKNRVKLVDLLGKTGDGLTDSSQESIFHSQISKSELSQACLVLCPTNYTPYMLQYFNPQLLVHWGARPCPDPGPKRGIMFYLKGCMKRLNLVHFAINRPQIHGGLTDLRRECLLRIALHDDTPDPQNIEGSGVFTFFKGYDGPLRVWDSQSDKHFRVFPEAHLLKTVVDPGDEEQMQLTDEELNLRIIEYKKLRRGQFDVIYPQDVVKKTKYQKAIKTGRTKPQLILRNELRSINFELRQRRELIADDAEKPFMEFSSESFTPVNRRVCRRLKQKQASGRVLQGAKLKDSNSDEDHNETQLEGFQNDGADDSENTGQQQSQIENVSSRHENATQKKVCQKCQQQECFKPNLHVQSLPSIMLYSTKTNQRQLVSIPQISVAGKPQPKTELTVRRLRSLAIYVEAQKTSSPITSNQRSVSFSRPQQKLEPKNGKPLIVSVKEVSSPPRPKLEPIEPKIEDGPPRVQRDTIARKTVSKQTDLSAFGLPLPLQLSRTPLKKPPETRPLGSQSAAAGLAQRGSSLVRTPSSTGERGELGRYSNFLVSRMSAEPQTPPRSAFRPDTAKLRQSTPEGSFGQKQPGSQLGSPAARLEAALHQISNEERVETRVLKRGGDSVQLAPETRDNKEYRLLGKRFDRPFGQ